MFMLFIGLIAAGTLAAWRNWRWGVYAAILVGLLQDPVRKMLPGTPASLTLATVPIWLGVAAHILMHRRAVLSRFLAGFPVLAGHLSRFALYLIVPAYLSLTYGRGTWQITLLGVFVYGAGFGLALAGWAGWRDARQIDQFLGFYALGTGIMLLGGILEFLGWGPRSVLIGADALDHVWVTHRTGEAVYMLAGFFRSPDVMGWHAVTVFMFAFILAMRSRGKIRILWIGMVLWGLLGIWVCGRRKMIAMLPFFLGSYLLLVFRVRGARRVLSMVAITAVALTLGLYMIGRVYPNSPVSRFYMTIFDETGDTVVQHGWRAVIGTVQQAGVLGYGLGMSQQGVHNINAEKPRLWQESGPGKLVAELGIPGSILFLLLGYVLLRTGYEVIRLHTGKDTVYLYAGVFSLLVANLASSVVSAQIYGDPFVVLFLAFLMGVLLAGARMEGEGSEKAEKLKWER